MVPRRSVRVMAVSLHVPAEGRTPARLLRPWQLADMSDLLAAMGEEYPARGLWSQPDQRGRRVGHVGLKNREGGQVGTGGFGEIGYWTAAAVRGLGIACRHVMPGGSSSALARVTRRLDRQPVSRIGHNRDLGGWSYVLNWWAILGSNQ